MQEPSIPPDEESRLQTLHSLNILDTQPEERFDRLTRIARRMFSVPTAVVTLIDADRQWFKSKAGLEISETPRDVSFCAHAILGSEIMHVEDASKDERFHDNPLVTGEPHIRFYAGCPLRVGPHKIGTFCLIAPEPREFTEEEKNLLRDLAGLAEKDLAEEHTASIDQLTGLANRRGFEASARHILAVSRRLGAPATLMFLDLDGFKQINDRFGHAEGDNVLKLFANGLLSVFRASDTVARLGGDEFVVLFINTTAAEVGRAVARLQAWVAEENRIGMRGYEIAFSAGAVEFDAKRHESIEDILGAADSAMYRDKNDGRA